MKTPVPETVFLILLLAMIHCPPFFLVCQDNARLRVRHFSSLRMCFNSKDGDSPEIYGAWAVVGGYAEGARVCHGGPCAGGYRASGAGADCAGAILQPELRLLQRVRQEIGRASCRERVQIS